MKHLKTLLFATALFIGATSFTAAQSKVAHINTQELIKAMPEYTAAQAEIEKLGKTYEATIQESLKELDVKLKQYNAEAEAPFNIVIDSMFSGSMSLAALPPSTVRVSRLPPIISSWSIEVEREMSGASIQISPGLPWMRALTIALA